MIIIIIIILITITIIIIQQCKVTYVSFIRLYNIVKLQVNYLKRTPLLGRSLFLTILPHIFSNVTVTYFHAGTTSKYSFAFRTLEIFFQEKKLLYSRTMTSVFQQMKHCIWVWPTLCYTNGTRDNYDLRLIIFYADF